MKKIKYSFILLCSIVAFSCKNEQKTEEPSEVFPITTVSKSDTLSFQEYVSEIHAIQNVEIRARVTGYLEKIHVDEGIYVKEGQLLFSINSKEYTEELAKAYAVCKSANVEVEAAEIELKNTLQLAEKKIVSQTEVALAKNKLEAQKAKLDEARAHQAYVQIKLSNTEIKAPFSGILNRIPHKIGSLINEGTLLTTISENDQVYAYFDVSEKEYLTYAKKLKSDSATSKEVTLILADGTEHAYKGKIETMEGVIEEGTGNIAFRAKFPNPEKLIKHGASGKIRLEKNFKDIIILPQKSTFEIQDRIYVYKVNKENKVESCPVNCVARLSHFYIVNEGINEGEKIVYEGIQRLKPNMIIKTESRSMNGIIKELAAK
ncbi:MAG: efflux RND transporter periplasmic adaptor subunit [Bacteroidota bacterium]|jgi:RND family efflux transporter MFP subunit